MATHGENNFDAVRLIAAAAVIYGHAHPLTKAPDVGFMGNSVQSFAVKVFFVVSGFLITTSWLADSNIRRYLEKRALRIFPALIIVVLLCAFVLGPTVTTLPATEYFSNGRTRAYLWNILLRPSYDLPAVFSNLPYPVAVNGSLWSLPVEFAMYLVLPVLCAVSIRFQPRLTFLVITTVGCVVALLYTRVLPPPARPVVFYGTSLTSTLDAAPYFLLGACYRFLRIERTLSPVAALGAISLVLFFQPQGALVAELTLYVVAPYAILSFALSPHPIFSRVGRWGDFSYGLYLYGFPVQQTVNFFSGRPLSALENTMISLPIALGLAVASWYIVEKRALTLKPRAQKLPQPVVPHEPAT
jgi:peptidoglycan/LPS O-acetylase OafA/YrhL